VIILAEGGKIECCPVYIEVCPHKAAICLKSLNHTFDLTGPR